MKRYLNSIKLQPQIIAIIFIEITFAIVTLPEVFANTINVTREITAPADKVWKIISNVDYEKILVLLRSGILVIDFLRRSSFL